MSIDLLTHYLPIANVILLAMGLFMSMKYVSRKEHELIIQRVTVLESTIPDVAKMANDMAEVRGELKMQSERFNSIQRNIEMLIENEIRGENNVNN